MIKWFSRKKRPQFHPWDLNAPLFWFGGKDIVTVGDAYEGIAVFGGIGSGKTTGSGFLVCSSMLHSGFGGLVLTTKIDEVHRWIRLMEKCGRSEDLIIFDEESGHTFNFLEYQHACQGGRTGMTENLVNLVEEMSEISNRMNGFQASQGDEAYFRNGRRALSRNLFDLVEVSIGSVTIPYLVEVLRDIPRTIKQAQSESWRQSSLICRLLDRARARHEDPLILREIDQIEDYFLVSIAGLAEKTRSVFESGIIGILDLFTRGALFRLYGRGTTITPKAAFEGKVIVVNQPIKRDFSIGAIGQTIWKTQFQQTMELRSPDDYRPCFLCIDEAQNFLTSMRDMHFAATARSSKCANIWLTQNISNMYVAMGGGDVGRAITDSLLGMAQTKIFHQNSDAVTNEWAAESIGRRKLKMRSSSVQFPGRRHDEWFEDEPSYTAGSSESYEFAVQPSVFTSLAKGGNKRMETEAIIFQGGRRWHGSGETFMRVHFNQGF